MRREGEKMDKDKVRMDAAGNRLIYALLNLIWMASLLFGKTTLIGYAIGIVGVIAASASLFVGKKNEKTVWKGEPAIVWMAFWDVITISAVKLYPSLVVVQLKNFEYFMNDLNTYFFVLLLAGIVVWNSGKKKRNFKMQYLAVELWLLWIIMLRESIQASSPILILFGYFISMSVLFALWFLLLQSIDTANREIPQYKGLQSATVLLLLFYFLKTYLFRPILDAYLYSYPMRLEQLFSRTLSFWPVMIFFVLLLIASLVAGSAEKSETKRCGCDAVILAAAGCVLLLLHGLKEYYFPGNVLVFAVFGIFLVKEMQAESAGMVRKWNGRWRLLAETVGLYVSMNLIASGYWPLLLLAAVLYYVYSYLKKKGKGIDPYYYFLAALFAEAAFCSLVVKMNPDYIRLAAVILLILVALMRFMSWPHPSLTRDRSDVKKCICMIAAALMFIWILKDGRESMVQVSYDGTQNLATMTMDENTEIVEGQYYWSNMIFGRRKSSYKTLGVISNATKYEYAETVQAGTLTIITVDKNGTTRRRTYHFPLMFYGWGE